MNDKKGREIFKCALGFALAILVIAGSIFGLDIKFEVSDTNPPAVEDSAVTEPPTEDTPQCPEDVENVEDVEDTPVVDETPETSETPAETPQAEIPADSTPTEIPNESVETPIETTTTEGDEQDA